MGDWNHSISKVTLFSAWQPDSPSAPPPPPGRYSGPERVCSWSARQTCPGSSAFGTLQVWRLNYALGWNWLVWSFCQIHLLQWLKGGLKWKLHNFLFNLNVNLWMFEAVWAASVVPRVEAPCPACAPVTPVWASRLPATSVWWPSRAGCPSKTQGPTGLAYNI